MQFRVVSKTGCAAIVGWSASIVAAAAAALGGCSGCDDGGFPVDAALPDATLRGTVSLAWSLTDLTGRPIQCDEVGATFVFLELRSKSTLSGTVASFSCGNSPSMSPPLEVGTYDIRFELHGPALTSVPAPMQSDVVIAANQDTRLQPVTFPVDTTGQLVLGLAAPPRTTNCGGTTMMGAGITTMTITLVRGDGGCAPVTFVRTHGSTTVGNYTVNCSSPQVSSCIERDETLTVASLPSGPYTIHVRGKIGAADCWANDDAFSVPAQGKARADTLNLAFKSGAPGC
jgi:hypothetical protein